MNKTIKPQAASFVWVTIVLISTSVPAQLIVAHRGASHDAPENTLAAFELAWQQSADGIEGDFRLTKDGRIVCIHDETTERTAGINLNVADTSYDRLSQLDVGKWKDARFTGQKIPTLEQVIATVPPRGRAVIELKTGPEIVPPLKKILSSSKLTNEQVLVISFNEKTIAESKRLLPEIKAHWLTGYEKNASGQWTPTAKQVTQTLSACGADGLGCQGERSVFDMTFIRHLSRTGFPEFHVWTVDDPEVASFYQALGAYGITTNRPRLIRNHLGVDGTSLLKR